MSVHLRAGPFVVGIGALLLTLCLLAHSVFAEFASKTNSVVSPTEQASALAAAQFEAIVQLQAQQESTLRALEQSRLEIAASLAILSSNNVAHLKTMSEKLSEQRGQDLKILRYSYRVVLAILAGLTGLLLVSILFLNVTSTRAINRLIEVFQSSAVVPTTALPPASTRQLLLSPGERGQPQLGSALTQLQRRIQALEHVALKSQTAGVQQTVEVPANQTPPQSGGVAA